jgi:hypothetical protein
MNCSLLVWSVKDLDFFVETMCTCGLPYALAPTVASAPTFFYYIELSTYI